MRSDRSGKPAPARRARGTGPRILRAGRWAAFLCGSGVGVFAAELPPDQVEFFEAKIRPILAESCYKCHSTEAGKSKGGLLLDTRDALRKGGGSGPVIVAGEPEQSLLIEAVRYKSEDLQMPPPDEGGKLSDEKIALLVQWVKAGAPDPRVGGKPHPMDMAAARQHWAFQAVRKPAVPAVKDGARVATPVDAFVLAQLEAKNLTLAAPADARTLLRRVTYDLTGLPPTAEEMDTFLADKAPDAYGRVVERLLASPRYGERWGRFWLDVARFADTKGYLAGNVERRFPFSHTYRDYVIRAFNEDKPFDRFVVEQIAADHLPLGDDKSVLAALGFLTLGRRFLNNQNDIIDDRIDVVTRGLMGLTVSCARCHDHKFDPIPTQDYYSLHGVFASSEEPAERPLLGPLVPTPAYQQFLDKTAEIEAKVKAREAEEVAKFLAGVRSKTGDYLLAAHDATRLKPGEKIDVFAGARKLSPEVLKRWQTFLKAQANVDAGARSPVLAPWFALAALDEADFATRAAELIAQWQANGAGAHTRVVAALATSGKPVATLKDVAAAYNRVFAELEKAREAEPTPAEESEAAAADVAELRQLVDADGAPANVDYATAAEMIRREINNKTAALKREIEALNWTEPGAPLRAMALVDKAKPANSKVFLRGNPANRGPEAPRRFLEVLAGEERAAFQQGSGRFELAQEIVNPKNPLTARVLVNRVWGWHFGQALVRTPSDFGVRTEAPVQQPLLDWLAASFVENGWSVKQLHRWIVLSSTYRQASESHPATASVDPDNQFVDRFNRRRLEWEAMRDTLLAVAGTLDVTPGGLPDDLTKEPFTRRRTVYGFIDRQNLPGIFRTFDYPNPDVSSAQRFATTVPQQALFMMNSPFVLEQARALVRRPEVLSATEPERVRALYRLVYQRWPDAEEQALAATFLRQPPQGEPPMPPAAGWQYGHGGFDAASNRTRGFEALRVRTAQRVAPGDVFPDPKLGHLSITATGGHPGRSADHASIRRWTAPTAGVIRIEGTLAHASEKGDGVRGRIVSSAKGKLGEWVVQHGKEPTTVAAVKVEPGETIDFMVDMRGDSDSDSYTWAPSITYTGKAAKTARAWNARKDFDAVEKQPERLTRWEEFAQVLLLANEAVFVD